MGDPDEEDYELDVDMEEVRRQYSEAHQQRSDDHPQEQIGTPQLVQNDGFGEDDGEVDE